MNKHVDRKALVAGLRRQERQYLDAGLAKPGSKLAIEMSGAAGAIARILVLLEGNAYAPKRSGAR